MAKKCTTIQNTLCIAILLLIKPFVWWISCCCHGLLKLPVVLGWGQWEYNPIFPSTHLWKRVAVGGKMTVLNNLLIWWPRWTSNEELWGQVRQQPIGQEIRQRDWGWIGNTLKRPDRYPAKRATEGKRKRSRPQHTWRCTCMAELRRDRSSVRKWNALLKIGSDGGHQWTTYVQLGMKWKGRVCVIIDEVYLLSLEWTVRDLRKPRRPAKIAG